MGAQVGIFERVHGGEVDSEREAELETEVILDPDANLAEQIELARVILKKVDAVAEAEELSDDLEISHEVVDDAERLAELVIALDGWLRRRGFLPGAWKK